MRHALERMAVGVALCLVVVGCRNDGLSAYATGLQRRITPPGGRSTAIALVRATNASRTLTWDVHTGWSSERYIEWLTTTLSADFTRRPTAANPLVFTRRLSGDVYRLECQFDSTEGVTIVHVSFMAVAD
jgi:hypothetical protein